jgi:hypothetical protein
MRTDFIDYPTAWEIQKSDGFEQLPHHPKCSSVKGSNGGMGGPGLLCDCGELEKEWKRRIEQEKN